MVASVADPLGNLYPLGFLVEFGEVVGIVFIRKLIINTIVEGSDVDRGWENNFPKKVRCAAEQDRTHDDPFPKFKKWIAVQ